MWRSSLIWNDGNLNTCEDNDIVWEEGFRQDLALDVNACVIKEQVLWVTVDIVQAHMQKVIEVNILILTILIAVDD
jgi:hypothetical protein